jgi:hypothetical protein
MGAGPDASKSQNWRVRRVQEWLLLLLRFAITRHPDDQEAALRTAGEIDSLGIKDGSSAPSFFRRSTTEVCGAIAASEHGSERHEILTKHLARIEDPRLRRAFRAGVDLDESSQQRTVRARRQDLWRGRKR